MAITKKPVGEARAIAAAGNIVGQAQRAEEERARAERTRTAQVAREWELQKMVLNSQQDFAHEQRLRQAELEAEARSKEWEVEKMEIKSRIDFEREEKQRAKIMDLYGARAEKTREYLEKNPSEKAKYQHILDWQEYVRDTGHYQTSPAYFRSQKEDAFDKYVSQLGETETVGDADKVKTDTTVSAAAGIAPPKPGHVKAISPDGVVGEVPVEEWEENEQGQFNGYKLLSGKEKTAEQVPNKVTMIDPKSGVTANLDISKQKEFEAKGWKVVNKYTSTKTDYGYLQNLFPEPTSKLRTKGTRF